MNGLLAIDLGTSGVKVVVVDPVSWLPVAEANVDYPVLRPRTGWAESDPEAWWQATVQAVRQAVELAPSVRIAGVGIDGQMHGCVLIDAAGVPVRSALIWADQRAVDQLPRWRSLTDAQRLPLGNPIAPGMTGPLWSWVRDHEPDVEAKARYVLLPKDFIRFRLTGTIATDPSDASATLLWNLPNDSWDLDVIAAVGLDPQKLPAVVQSHDDVGALTAEAAGALGLMAGTPVVAGAADTAATLYATGLSNPMDVQVTVGTGAQVVRPLSTPEFAHDPVVHCYRSAQPNSWYAMAAIQNGGLALDWVRSIFNASWDELYSAALTHSPGADGVVFVPYLTGERSPVLSDHARGAFFGLALASDRNAILQAAVEGIAFAIRHGFEALPGGRPARVRIAGGGTQGSQFRQLLAGVLGIELEPVSMRSASAVGAAMLAARAAGIEGEAPAVRADAVIPVPNDAEAYDEAFAAYTTRAAELTD